MTHAFPLPPEPEPDPIWEPAPLARDVAGLLALHIAADPVLGGNAAVASLDAVIVQAARSDPQLRRCRDRMTPMHHRPGIRAALAAAMADLSPAVARQLAEKAREAVEAGGAALRTRLDELAAETGFHGGGSMLTHHDTRLTVMCPACHADHGYDVRVPGEWSTGDGDGRSSPSGWFLMFTCPATARRFVATPQAMLPEHFVPSGSPFGNAQVETPVVAPQVVEAPDPQDIFEQKIHDDPGVLCPACGNEHRYAVTLTGSERMIPSIDVARQRPASAAFTQVFQCPETRARVLATVSVTVPPAFQVRSASFGPGVEDPTMLGPVLLEE